MRLKPKKNRHRLDSYRSLNIKRISKEILFMGKCVQRNGWQKPKSVFVSDVFPCDQNTRTPFIYEKSQWTHNKSIYIYDMKNMLRFYNDKKWHQTSSHETSLDTDCDMSDDRTEYVFRLFFFLSPYFMMWYFFVLDDSFAVVFNFYFFRLTYCKFQNGAQTSQKLVNKKVLRSDCCQSLSSIVEHVTRSLLFFHCLFSLRFSVRTLRRFMHEYMKLISVAICSHL